MWNPETGSDTKCPAMKPMCQSCFIINCQLLTPFTSGPWLKKRAVQHSCPHRCGTRTLGQTSSVRPWKGCVKSCLIIINCKLLTPFTCGPSHRCGTRTLGRTPSVRPWNQCVKSCFVINCQLLTPFTSGPWFQK